MSSWREVNGGLSKGTHLSESLSCVATSKMSEVKARSASVTTLPPSSFPLTRCASVRLEMSPSRRSSQVA